MQLVQTQTQEITSMQMRNRRWEIVTDEYNTELQQERRRYIDLFAHEQGLVAWTSNLEEREQSVARAQAHQETHLSFLRNKLLESQKQHDYVYHQLRGENSLCRRLGDERKEEARAAATLMLELRRANDTLKTKGDEQFTQLPATKQLSARSLRQERQGPVRSTCKACLILTVDSRTCHGKEEHTLLPRRGQRLSGIL